MKIYTFEHLHANYLLFIIYHIYMENDNRSKWFRDNQYLCEQEFEIIQEIFKNSELINYLKDYLNSVIEKMVNIGFDKKSFFSDDKTEMGNIGTENPDENFNYILTNIATIREKVNSLINTFVVTSTKTTKKSVIHLVNFVFTHNSAWNKQRIEQLKKITNKTTVQKVKKYIIKNEFLDLWAPLMYIYPGYVFKRALYHSANLKPPTNCKGWETQIIEPFTEKEKKFYGDSLNFHTGKCWYNDMLHLFKEDGKCSVAGTSGHAILLLELVKVLDIDWKPMMLCALLTNVPYHHSIDEVIRCIFIMNLDDSYKNKSNEKIIHDLVKSKRLNAIPASQNSERITKNKKTQNKKTKRRASSKKQQISKK